MYVGGEERRTGIEYRRGVHRSRGRALSRAQLQLDQLASFLAGVSFLSVVRSGLQTASCQRQIAISIRALGKGHI